MAQGPQKPAFHAIRLSSMILISQIKNIRFTNQYRRRIYTPRPTNPGGESGCLGRRKGQKRLPSAAEMEIPMSTPYPVVPIAAGTLVRVLTAALAPIVAVLKSVERAMRHRREANVLARLDRHMLADIGITRSDLQDAFSTPLWQDPTELLSDRAQERRLGRKAMRAQSRALIEPGFHRPATDRPARHAV
jgi:uncharacterized protein YjiS (DUF1127 family)